MSAVTGGVADHPTAVAVVGMAGRFPGAADVAAFWRNLAAGVESIRFFTDDDLRAEGLDPALARRPGYVAARGALDDPAAFDAAFFGITPGEAALLDPQQRLFLECAWAALEDAALDTERFAGSVGVYGGVSLSTYHARVLAAPGVDPFQAGMGNDKDFLATRVAFKLNLRGPAVVVQSACSTSLVAVHLACQALLNAECDVALAGGASVAVPHRAGYLHQEGGILSPDGHCRAFDARAAGTVPGAGAGVVVLRRLADALADGDPVRAVIRGSALNNDGAGKVGYTAPSVDGQARVVAEALAVAGVDPATVGYVEAHGTATEIGDPTEVAALARALGPGRSGRCALGSVKTNVGHLDAAAGVAGLIKTVLALEHRQIPPSLHFTEPNPRIDFAATPLRVADRLLPWEAADAPRRAGVSSFGIGGTNAHVVLEEAPPAPSGGAARPWQLLALSARAPAALARARERLAAHLAADPAAPLADVAFTLHVGRRPMPHRAAIVARTSAEAVAALREDGAGAGAVPAGGRGVAFLFPGQGAQYPGMGRGLYAAHAVFRREVDRCAETLAPFLGVDLRELLNADPGDAAAAERLRRTALAQPALFVVEHALVRLWDAWGVRPAAMLGHSIGEYVAACAAGVFTLDEALALVAERGRLMDALPPGAMTAVPLPEAELAPLLGDDVALAAVNAPAACVVAGAAHAVRALEERLDARGVASRRLHTSHAFHSPMMEPAAAPFHAAVSRAQPRPPRIPFLSNVTGRPITDADACDPAYWVRQMRSPVRFGAGAAELLREPGRAFLEVGPGRTLATLVRRQAADASVATSLPGPGDGADDEAAFLEGAGRLWAVGAAVRLDAAWEGETRRRVRLPTYPFEPQRCWIDLPARPAPVPGGDGAPAPPPPGDAMPQRDRRARIARLLQETFGRVLGIDATAVEPRARFLELGADSLLLLQASRAVEERFGTRVPFRALMEGLSSVEALAAHLHETLPPDAVPGEAQTEAAPALPAASASSSAEPSTPATPAGTMAEGAVERVMAQQLQVMREVMAQQLDVLRGASGGVPPVATAAVSAATSIPEPAGAAFGPFRPHRAEGVAGEELTPRQRAHLDALVARYTARTAGSKRRAAEERSRVADPRAAVGFRMLWKEMIYPVVGARSAGSRLWDVDGNEYVDFTMGFGVHLFGHSPPFVVRAMEAQLARGLHLGPQSDLAGDVARRLLSLTGMERVAFCNTGTEAVMTALRLARAATGRRTVALFAGAYHGHFDGVLGRPRAVDGVPRAVPVAEGITPAMVEDLLVLEYGTPASLDAIRAHADGLAAVLVEPLQSRRPDFLPAAYLHELRALTRQAGVPLVFDEIITGFRLHPGGAQGLLGLRADLATYGKVLAGGLPIGAVAGDARFLDTIDGGAWRYGDASFPEVGQTLFAGTFSKNPLTMAAAGASLEHLERSGPALQEGLTRRTAQLAARLTAVFARRGAPLRVVHGGSLFRLEWPASARHVELLFYHLLERGVYVWEGRGCFVSTAHTDADLDRLVDAVAESLDALREGGFLPGEGAVSPVSVDVGGDADPTVPSPSAVSAAAGGDGVVRVRPLTAAQRQLWVHTQVGPEASLAYNELLALRIRGPLDADSAGRAVQRLVDRHEALRTTFAPDGESQRVHPALLVPLQVASAVPGTTPGETTDAVLDAELHGRFDLAEGPLVRARLHRLAEGDHLFVLAVHHLAADGYSMAVLGRELRALLAGDGAALPGAMQFSEYADRLAARERGPEMADAEAFWRRELEGAVALELPADRPPSRTGEHGGGRESLSLPAELSAAVRRLGAEAGATPFMTLAAAFLALLHRVTGQDDVLVGTPSLGRTFDGDEALVGHCVDLLPVRSRLAGDPTFAEHLAATRARLLGALQHRVFSLGHRSAGRGAPLPPLAVTFNYEPTPAGGDGARPGDGASLRVEPVSPPVRRAKFDLGVDVVERGGAFHLSCIYDSHRFSDAWVHALLERFAALLADAARHPERRLRALPLLLPGERERVLHAWSGAASDPPPSPPVHRGVEAQAARLPGAVAVLGDEEPLSYAALNARANRLARHLRAGGVGPDTPVGVLMERSAALVVALLAVLKAGGAYLPLDPGSPPERLAYVIGEAGASLVIADADLAALVPAGVTTIRPGAEDERARIAAEDDGDLHGEPDPEGLAYVIHTSGSTGRPKGVAVPHRALANHMAWMAAAFPLTPADRVVLKTPVTFDAAVWEVWAPLMAGATLVVAPPEAHRDPERLVREVARSGATTLQLVPTVLAAVLEEPGLERCTSLRRLFVGGEALPAALARRAAERLPAAEVVNLYGPTEATVDATWHRFDPGEDTGATVPIGRPVDGVHALVLDAGLEPVPPGLPGELYLGGAGLARGYPAASGLTAERFVPDPFGEAGARLYRTGDRARWRADGVLEYLGRADDQLKVRGFRVEPGEVESVLREHPLVAATAVAVRGSGHGARLGAWVVAATGTPPDPDELRRFLRDRLPEPLVPSFFVPLNALPLTPSGKTDRRALPEPCRGAAAAPGSGLEHRVAALWCDLLETDEVGLDDNFFDRGGTSLLLVRLTHRLRELGDDPPTTTELFEHSTVRTQAARLARGARAPAEPAAAVAAAPGRLAEGAGRLALLRGMGRAGGLP